MIRGENDDELPTLVEYAGRVGAEIRFIEYMDVGGATRWSASRVVPRDEILARSSARSAPLTPIGQPRARAGVALRAAGGQMLGVIASTTEPFCGDCDRARLTADGQLLTCLYATRRRRSARPAARRRRPTPSSRRSIRGTWRGARRSRRRGASRGRRTDRVHRPRRAAARAAPRNAHPRRLNPRAAVEYAGHHRSRGSSAAPTRSSRRPASSSPPPSSVAWADARRTRASPTTWTT